jgi:hypothetical protein
MIEVKLPMPPSANNLFFNLKGRGGRAKTQAYKDWLRIAKAECLVAYHQAGKPTFDPKQKMSLHIRVGLNYRGDISNRAKACEDALCAFLPIPDDRYNDRVTIERDMDCEGFVVATICGVDAL